MSTPWPVADVDPVRRLHVMAAVVRGAQVTERLLESSVDEVWSILSDFEGGFTAVQPDMRRVRVVSRSDGQVSLTAVSRYGFRARLHGPVGAGWCWLQSRFLIIGMAATEARDGRTLVALTGGVRVPGRAAIVPVRVRREAQQSLDRLQTMLRPSS